MCSGSLIRPFAVLAALAPGLALANPQVGPGLATLDYGIYCAETPDIVEEAPGTASGVINLVAEIPVLRWRQLVVPDDIGIGFGVIVEPHPGETLEPVIVTVTHPPFPDSGIEVEQWITTIESDSQSLMGFSFELPEEQVHGEWTFSASYEGEELYHIAFEVVPGSALPNMVITCMGGALS